MTTIKDKIAILPSFHSHFLHIWDTSKFWHELRTNPPIGPLYPPMEGWGDMSPHSKTSTGNPDLWTITRLITGAWGCTFSYQLWTIFNDFGGYSQHIQPFSWSISVFLGLYQSILVYYICLSLFISVYHGLSWAVLVVYSIYCTSI